jgi:hypothetical protein
LQKWPKKRIPYPTFNIQDFKLERYWKFKLHNKVILRLKQGTNGTIHSGLAVLTEKPKNCVNAGGKRRSGDQFAPLDPRWLVFCLLLPCIID